MSPTYYHTELTLISRYVRFFSFFNRRIVGGVIFKESVEARPRPRTQMNLFIPEQFPRTQLLVDIIVSSSSAISRKSNGGSGAGFFFDALSSLRHAGEKAVE